MRYRPFAILVLAVVAVTALAGPAAARPEPRGRAAERALLEQLAPGSRVTRDRASGEIRAIRGGRRGLATARELGSPRTPTGAARAFLDRYGALLGVTAPGRQLAVARVDRTGRTGTYVRYQQQLDGVPVLGGDLVVVVDRQRGVQAVRGETTRATVDVVRPQISPAAAMREARAAVARATGLPQSRLRAAAPSRWVFDPRLLGAPGLPYARLVWRTEVTDATGLVDWFVAVDARTGDVALRFDQLAAGASEDAAQRICDQKQKRETVLDRLPCKAADALATPYALVDAVRAAASTEAAYDFYRLRFGLDLATRLAGSGGSLTSTVRYCPEPGGGSCPYPNAFWTGSQMVYGTGFASADDVVGHELTHGVTERASGLFYYMQSGAINEALSDIFGESIDLTDDLPFDTDTEDKRWRIGEDLASIGVIRNMEDPTLLGDPDSVDSPLWDDDPDETDQGGVHANSGVANHAFYLMVEGPEPLDGDRDVALDQALAIWYLAASSLLTTASDYDDLASSLLIACDQLAGVADGVKDKDGAVTTPIVASDCDENGAVAAAIDVTNMSWQQRPGKGSPAPVCTDPAATADVLLDDPIDGTGSGWTFDGTIGRRWSVWDGYGFPATQGDTPFHLYGADLSTTADRRIRRTAAVTIPAGPRPVFLRFRHAYGFDDGSEDLAPNDRLYDGGVVEVSADGGPWTDISSLFTDNGPTGRIYAGDENPLGGRIGFGAESGGYITARVELSGRPGLSFAGKHVRLSFRMGTDSAYGGEGWFIDDVLIYTCENAGESDAPAPGPLRLSIATGTLGTTGRVPVAVGSTTPTFAGAIVHGVSAQVGAGPLNTVGGRIGGDGAVTITGSLATSPATQTLTWSAVDENGDTGTRTRDVDVRLLQQTAFSFTGAWSSKSSSSASGGSVRSASSAGRKARITVTAEDIAVIAPTGPDRGKARMCLDGGACRTVDLYSPKASPRRVVARWDDDATDEHTVTITVLGTKASRSSGTRVDLDALVTAG